MGRIVLSANVSLDGVVEDPDGLEGFERGGWFGRFGGDDLDAWADVELAEALEAAALLLGRRSDEWFATRWTSREGPWADRLNGLPKYVVSTTLDAARWTNARVLGGDVVRAVTALVQEIDGDIVVYGSVRLARTLIDHDLVDEVRLIVFPVVLGDGARLFGGTRAERPVRLLRSRTVGQGLVALTYEVVRRPTATDA